jgi:hypothetical protein
LACVERFKPRINQSPGERIQGVVNLLSDRDELDSQLGEELPSRWRERLFVVVRHDDSIAQQDSFHEAL